MMVASWVTGVQFTTLFVEDLQKTKHFYKEIFGLQVLYEDEDSTVFNFGNMSINLLKKSAAHELIEPAVVADRNVGSTFQFTIEVNDVDNVCLELKKHGITLLNGPMNRPWGIRTASFTDPAGFIWEIAGPLAEHNV